MTRGCVGGPHVAGSDGDCVYCENEQLRREIIESHAQCVRLRAVCEHVLARGEVGKQSRERLKEAVR